MQERRFQEVRITPNCDGSRERMAFAGSVSWDGWGWRPELNELLSEPMSLPGSFPAFAIMVVGEVVLIDESPRRVYRLRQCWVL